MDGDIKISKKEWEMYYSNTFNKKDKNKDGFLRQEDLQPKKFDFSKYDMDKDSKITLSDFLDPTQQRFNNLDNNNDGSITQDDLKLLKKPETFNFAKYDKDGNGIIFLEDFLEPVKNRFSNLDKTKDDLITMDDLKPDALFLKKLDADNDGKVNHAEWMGSKNKDFTKKDFNNDGYISKLEFMMK